MNKLLIILASFILYSSNALAREVSSFNSDWKFARFGALADGTQKEEPKGLEQIDANDADWRILNVPHDWGIEGPFRAELPNQTGKLPWAGIGWYRKTFESPASDQDKRVYIEFDGAMSGTTVWLNGKEVGEWPYGYSSFQFELTEHLNIGASNTLAVRLNNKPDSSRWYPGGGIYRNVRLIKTAPVHVAQWGTFVTTPEVSAETATINIKTTLSDNSQKGVRILHQLFELNSEELLVRGNGSNCDLKLSSPKLWNLETPHLYKIRTSVQQYGVEIDHYETEFGIRTIEYTADEGFLLNGKVVRMNGVCQHHDLGPLGAAVNVRAMERQIEILKSFGVNAIRSSHNPPAPEFLDLCNRMGILVQVEAFDVWEMKKVDNDYSTLFAKWHKKDLQAMVRRDRNHPCVVMWSTGNEMIELRHDEGAELAIKLADIIRAEDLTRPTTFGCSRPEAIETSWKHAADVFGLNYKPHLYKTLRKDKPNLPIYGSETASTVSSRGEYFFPVSNNKKEGSGGYFQVSSYDLSAPNWAYRPDIEFEAQDRNPWVFGEFVWTGFDYIGEPTPYNKDKTNLLNFSDPAEKARMKKELAALGGNIPPRSSYFGIVDLCGFPKDRYYMYKARWMPDEPLAHILPHWNWPERVGKVTPVHVYTSGDEAELFLNGKSQGRQKLEQYQYRFRWDEVVYEPGKLKVVTYKDGKKWATKQIRTTGEARELELSADRSEISADGQDLSFITVKVVDKKGQLVPRSHNDLKFSIYGPGEIIATGNGDPTNHQSFQALERKAFNGMALIVVRSLEGESGKITVTASSQNLKAAKIKLISQ